MKYPYEKAPLPIELTVSEGYGEGASDFQAQAISVPCQNGCPALTNVPAYIEKISQGKYDEAYAINLEDNVLPGVLGRICARPCQKECRHNWTDINGAVEICYLKRSAADRIEMKSESPKPYFEDTKQRVAIIGGGPAGLACARELKRYGHQVTLFEKEKQLGGMLVDGIPRFRLPENIIHQEISQIVETGIEVRTGQYIDTNKLAQLLSEFSAVVVSTGTVKANSLEIKGLEEKDAYSGLDFMKSYNRGEIQKLSGDVVIIGGGFTAVDSARACARTAKKLLGNRGDVTIVYRRTERFMAADYEELEEMERENIKILTLLSPVSVTKKKDQLESITLQKNYLGQTEKNGKPEIIPVEDGLLTLTCKHLIVAIGQKQDFSILPQGITRTQKFETSHPKLFTAGDFANGSLDVIHSIADGKEVSARIDTYMMGYKRLVKKIKIEKAHANGESGRQRQHDLQMPLPMQNLELKKRVFENKEVALGFDEKETDLHATRCYYCHYKFQIDQDKCIHCNWCIDVAPRNCIHKISHFDKDDEGIITKAYPAENDEETTFIWINSKDCIRCGKCLRVCPVQAIEMKKTTIVQVLKERE